MPLKSDFGGEYTGPKKKYPQLDEGVHEATLVAVTDRGIKETPWGEKRQIMFKWEGDETYTDEGETKPVTVVKTYNWTMGKGDKRSKLREDVEAILGQKLTDNEARALDLETLIGKRNQIYVEHNGDYANVTKIMKPKAAKGVMTEAEVLAAKEMFTT
jgi:hemin uptake protein HemP